MTDIAADPMGQKPLLSIDRGPASTALFMLLAGTLAIATLVDLRQAILFVIGGLLGVTLYHASFGFTGGWRRLVVERRGAAMRAQMLMIAITAIAFIPILSLGSIFGQPVVGATAPVGISVLLGAAMFGLGMQLGGGCGSGTLFTVGGGSARMLVTLLFFIFGALLGTLHLPWWLEQLVAATDRSWRKPWSACGDCRYAGQFGGRRLGDGACGATRAWLTGANNAFQRNRLELDFARPMASGQCRGASGAAQSHYIAYGRSPWPQN